MSPERILILLTSNLFCGLCEFFSSIKHPIALKKRLRTCRHILFVVFSRTIAEFDLTGPQPSTEVPEGPYPTLVKQDSGRVVPVVQAYAFTKYLGYLKLKFDDQGELVNWTGSPILLNSSYPQGDVINFNIFVTSYAIYDTRNPIY